MSWFKTYQKTSSPAVTNNIKVGDYVTSYYVGVWEVLAIEHDKLGRGNHQVRLKQVLNGKFGTNKLDGSERTCSIAWCAPVQEAVIQMDKDLEELRKIWKSNA